MLEKPFTDEELIDIIIKTEKNRARMDFTIPLFKYFAEVIERELPCKVLIKEKNSMLDYEL